MLILFLGTNDGLHHADLTAYDAARGAEILVKQARASETGYAGGAPKILVNSPPRIRELSRELAEFCYGDLAESDKFTEYFLRMTQQQ